MTKVIIYSKCINDISKKLISSGYSHTFTIYKGLGAYSNNIQWFAESICQYIELPDLVRSINSLDKKAIITVQSLTKVLGSMNVLDKVD